MQCLQIFGEFLLKYRNSILFILEGFFKVTVELHKPGFKISEQKQ